MEEKEPRGVDFTDGKEADEVAVDFVVDLREEEREVRFFESGCFAVDVDVDGVCFVLLERRKPDPSRKKSTEAPFDPGGGVFKFGWYSEEDIHSAPFVSPDSVGSHSFTYS